jgi:hypothetical protein
MFCAGLCARCYWSAQHSRRRFDGYRERVLARDRHSCRACGARQNLAEFIIVAAAFINLACSLRSVPPAMHACIGWLRSGAGWNPRSFPSGGNSTVVFRCNCSFLGTRPLNRPPRLRVISVVEEVRVCFTFCGCVSSA